ncbi:MAG: hypothetical protein IJQ66_04755 [Clostridia bacterium]|nr:hypothetical protein [Clostridia bacterium]
MDENRCIVCGEVIPEGRDVCPNCEEKTNAKMVTNFDVYDPKIYDTPDDADKTAL